MTPEQTSPAFPYTEMATSDAREGEVRDRMIAQLFGNVIPPLVTSSVIAAIVAFVMRDIIADVWLISWFTIVLTLNMGRYLFLRYQHAQLASMPAVRWAGLYTLTVFGSGIIWGAAGGFFFSPDSILYQVFLAFVLGGLAAGTMAGYAAWSPAFYAYLIPSMGPIILRFLWQGDEIPVVMGGMLLVYGLALSFLAGNVRASVRRTIQLELEKDDLLAEVSEARERYVLAIKGANDGMWDWDIESGKIYVSQRMGEIFNSRWLDEWIQVGEIITHIHPEDRGHFLSSMRAHLKGETEFLVCEFRIYGTDGNPRWVVDRGIAMRKTDGRAYRMAGSITDTTEQRHAVEETRRRHKMQALGNLAGGMAHNLNNLLLPIMALSEMSAEEMPIGSPTRERLEKVVYASESAKDLVHRVMAFSRPDAPERKNVDMCTLVSVALDLLPSMIPSTINARVNLDEDTGYIHADSAQMETVLLNLVFNAVDAIGAKTGVIEISLNRAPFDSASKKTTGYAQLTVMDTGKGMDKPTLERIFDPFFSTKDEGHATGLGLSSAQGIVAAHGGHIEVVSTPGAGTTFTVLLPLVEGSRAKENTIANA